jgi:hypothetical protein
VLVLVWFVIVFVIVFVFAFATQVCTQSAAGTLSRQKRQIFSSSLQNLQVGKNVAPAIKTFTWVLCACLIQAASLAALAT